MPEHTGYERPGGRTAETRRAVHDAVRRLRQDPDRELSVPAVAASSGVHATTIYRRWRTIESLMLDVAIDDLNDSSPVPSSGDLERDLRQYVPFLLESIRQEGRLNFFPLLVAARKRASGEEIADLVEPRLSRFQAMLDAAGVTRINATRLMELIMAPAYFWAQLGMFLDPRRDADRLIETVLAESGKRGGDPDPDR